MAQQLITTGQKVDLLILFDAPPVIPARARPGIGRRSFYVAGKLVTHLRRWAGGDPNFRTAELLSKGRRFANSLIDGLPLAAVRLARGGIPDGLLLRRAIESYSPRVYPCPIKLVRPMEQSQIPHPDTSPYWRALAGGGLEVLTTPGDHITMFQEPHIRVLAARISVWLQTANELAPHGLTG